MKLKELDGLYLKNKDIATKSFFTLIAPITPPVIIQDYDGNIYTSVRIGNQEWMVENLKTTHYIDGTPITNITGDVNWNAATTEGYCWYDDNYAVYGVIYGAMYNHFAVRNSHILAPVGWRVPTEEDVEILRDFLGGQLIAGGKMKESGLVHWTTPNTGADNNSGFTGIPGGRRGWGISSYITERVYFWCSNPQDDSPGVFGLLYNSAELDEGVSLGHPEFGNYVRCIRNV